MLQPGRRALLNLASKGLLHRIGYVVAVCQRPHELDLRCAGERVLALDDTRLEQITTRVVDAVADAAFEALAWS